MEDRLNKLIEYLGITSAQFADYINVQRSSISHILSGRNKPSYDFIVKILHKYPNINARWLLLGEGDIEKPSIHTESNKNEQAPHDLFTQSVENKDFNVNDNSSKKYQENNNPELNSNDNIHNNNEFTNVNNVKQIILIYDDNRFEVINRK